MNESTPETVGYADFNDKTGLFCEIGELFLRLNLKIPSVPTTEAGCTYPK